VNSVACQLVDVLDLRIEAIPISYSSYLEGSSDADLVLTLTTSAYPDCSAMLRPYRRGGHASAFGSSGDAFESAMNAAEAGDRRTRWRNYDVANDLLLEAMPVIPLLRAQATMLRRPEFDPLPMSSNGIVAFELA